MDTLRKTRTHAYLQPGPPFSNSSVDKYSNFFDSPTTCMGFEAKSASSLVVLAFFRINAEKDAEEGGTADGKQALHAKICRKSPVRSKRCELEITYQAQDRHQRDSCLAQ